MAIASRDIDHVLERLRSGVVPERGLEGIRATVTVRTPRDVPLEIDQRGGDVELWLGDGSIQGTGFGAPPRVGVLADEYSKFRGNRFGVHGRSSTRRSDLRGGHGHFF